VKGHQVNTVPLSAFTARDWLLQGPGTMQTGVGDDPMHSMGGHMWECDVMPDRGVVWWRHLCSLREGKTSAADNALLKQLSQTNH